MLRSNMRKVKIMIPAMIAASFSLSAMADEYFDRARVIAVAPQTERINYPRQECRTDYVRESYSTDRSPVGAIIGGFAGGLLGSQIGKGNGRVAGAAVGAGVGAVVGDRVDNNQPSGGYRTRPVESCYTVDNWQTVTRGYFVTYHYNGRDYTTMTDNDPGDFIRVRVAVGPGYGPQRIAILEPSYQDRGYDRRPAWNDDRGWKKHRDWNRGRGYGRDHDDD